MVTYKPVKTEFQSTLPARGATLCFNQQKQQLCISIHAPRTGSDDTESKMLSSRMDNFNPRSPHGERRPAMPRLSRRRRFQSTLPARGATRRCPPAQSPASHFNPRSPHGERRRSDDPTFTPSADFNPRSPHGERPERILHVADAILFQSTLPARGATGGVHSTST